MERLKVEIEGIVQGVGFRPFVYRLAQHHRLAGSVLNTSAGVTIEIEGEDFAIRRFLDALPHQAPPLAAITSIRTFTLPAMGSSSFNILPSIAGSCATNIPSDTAICDDCLRELFDPSNRRYHYPFINCTNCGPRYTIITGIPYDRRHTTMDSFTLCPDCLAEYEDPTNRRFHAEPTACAKCGPALRLLAPDGSQISGNPLATAIDLLRQGRIVAIKGAGGFHLAVDPVSHEAVAELRRRKRRDEKPFALMVPDFSAAAVLVEADSLAKRLLLSPERPIVLLRKKESAISPLVSPQNDYYGVMLPSTPLHHLLLQDNFLALIMTSGNVSDEPMACDKDEALSQLAGVADYFLIHDRTIRTRVDDSVIRVFQNEPLFLRRGRGYVPRPVKLSKGEFPILAVGAEMKGAVCITRGASAFMSQHIGDLQNPTAMASFVDVVEHMLNLLEVAPQIVAHDLHPDYLTTSYAKGLSNADLVGVQHHHAHMASCMAEYQLDEPVIGVIFDGLGYGLDGTLWGGEFLVGDCTTFNRIAHIALVPMPGGDIAVKEPYRMALAHLYPRCGKDIFALPLECTMNISADEAKLFLQMLAQGVNSPLTSSCGRLFDAAAAIIGLRTHSTYEGQAAIELEGIAEKSRSTDTYPYAIRHGSDVLQLDFGETISAILTETLDGRSREDIARTFHNTIASATAAMCAEIRAVTGIDKVVLSGGVFQNKLLAESLVKLLQDDLFSVHTHRLVPPNDGGLALGQAVIAMKQTIMHRSGKCA